MFIHYSPKKNFISNGWNILRSHTEKKLFTEMYQSTFSEIFYKTFCSRTRHETMNRKKKKIELNVCVFALCNEPDIDFEMKTNAQFNFIQILFLS